ncbi:hypothetical protein VTN77DRAFT_3522 [Rasamsonia byssochlamydoides]|uniref:uncharacterized protein n=1 Tax=Rasamsonia byssochlamydoides TaxID=89139 RepID=UPI0037420969
MALAGAGADKSSIRNVLRMYKAKLVAYKHQVASQMTSTPAPLFKQMETLFSPKIAIRTTEPEEDSYTLGWGNLGETDDSRNSPGKVVLHHQGNIVGMISSVHLITVTKTAILVMVNPLGWGDPTNWIGQLIVEAIFAEKELNDLVQLARDSNAGLLNNYAVLYPTLEEGEDAKAFHQNAGGISHAGKYYNSKTSFSKSPYRERNCDMFSWPCGRQDDLCRYCIVPWTWTGVHTVSSEVITNGISLLVWDHDPWQGPESFTRYEDDLSGKDARDEKYKTEKSYTSRYDPEGAFPPSNIEPMVYNIRIQNMRPLMQSLSYEQAGFQVAKLDSQMKYEDYMDPGKIREIHVSEVKALLKDLMGASRVYTLDFAVRRRHPTFPIATDYTREHVCSVIRRRLKSSADQALQCRWQCVNIWHPLKGPLVDWPLAVCDASTIDFVADSMPGDVVDRTEVFENMQVHYNPEQKWYWLPDQLPSELLIFKNADSRSSDGTTSHVGTPAVDSWPFCSSAWLAQCLPREIGRARLLTFDYAFPLGDNFTWGNLWQQGDRFLRALANSRRSDGTGPDTCPILFVCHSLGGLILKQALCIAKERMRRYETLINVVSGIIFLGTPHFQPSQVEKGMAILQTTTRFKVKISSQVTEQESSILSDLSARFEAIRIRCPILSVYETKKTKVPQGRFKHKKLILVDKHACTTHAPSEQFLSLPLDHIGICQFDRSDNNGDQKTISDFVRSSFQNAKEDIASGMEAMEYRYATTTAYSPTLSNPSLVELPGEGQPRGDSLGAPVDTTAATQGSITKGSSSQGFEVIPPDLNFERIGTSGRDPQLPCIMLEAETRNPNFFGREEVLQQIGQALLPPKTEFISSNPECLRRFALCGMGGIGKTLAQG